MSIPFWTFCRVQCLAICFQWIKLRHPSENPKCQVIGCHSRQISYHRCGIILPKFYHAFSSRQKSDILSFQSQTTWHFSWNYHCPWHQWFFFQALEGLEGLEDLEWSIGQTPQTSPCLPASVWPTVTRSPTWSASEFITGSMVLLGTCAWGVDMVF